MVGTRAPALVPCVFDLSTVALGGSAVLNAVRRLCGHAVLFGQFCAQRDALWRFFVKLLRHGRGATCGADGFDLNSFSDVALAHGEGVAPLSLRVQA